MNTLNSLSNKSGAKHVLRLCRCRTKGIFLEI